MRRHRKAPIVGAMFGASLAALALGAPAVAGEMTSGSTYNVPLAPDRADHWRPDPARKSLGEMERDMTEGKYDSPRAASPDYGRVGSGGSISSGASAPAATIEGSTRGMDGAADLTVETVRFDQLSPQAQAAVQGRMGPDQRPSELIETTILNRLALLGTGYTLDETRRFGPDYVLIVSDPDGQQATLLYVVDSDQLREVQM